MSTSALTSVPFFETIAPRYGLEERLWLRQQQPEWRTVGFVIGCIGLVLSLILLALGGYTSIQGVRAPLFGLGFPVTVEGIPSLRWWLLPVAQIIIQIFCKHIPFLLWLWRPSIWFDGLTNAVFFGIGLYPLVGSAAVAGVIAAPVGLALAVVAEKLFLGSLCLLLVGRVRRRA